MTVQFPLLVARFVSLLLMDFYTIMHDSNFLFSYSTNRVPVTTICFKIHSDRDVTNLHSGYLDVLAVGDCEVRSIQLVYMRVEMVQFDLF